eukprot:3204470-Prymnesium_polylepis.1
MAWANSHEDTASATRARPRGAPSSDPGPSRLCPWPCRLPPGASDRCAQNSNNGASTPSQPPVMRYVHRTIPLAATT